jgi:hypothetical protein
MKKSEIRAGGVYVGDKRAKRRVESVDGDQVTYVPIFKDGAEGETATVKLEGFAKWANKEFVERAAKEPKGPKLNLDNATLKEMGLTGRRVRSIAHGLEYYLKLARDNKLDLFVDAKGHGHLVHESKPAIVKGQFQPDALIAKVGDNFVAPTAK